MHDFQAHNINSVRLMLYSFNTKPYDEKIRFVNVYKYVRIGKNADFIFISSLDFNHYSYC